MGKGACWAVLRWVPPPHAVKSPKHIGAAKGWVVSQGLARSALLWRCQDTVNGGLLCQQPAIFL